MLLEKKNIKNSVLDYIRHKVKLVWLRAKDGPRKVPYKNFGMVPTWKAKKGTTSKFVNAGGYNRNERDFGIGDLEWVE